MAFNSSSPSTLFSSPAGGHSNDDLLSLQRKTENRNMMEKDLRKQLGLKKSIQMLEQVASPNYKSASPLLKDAGTPKLYLSKNRDNLFDEESDNEESIWVGPNLHESLNTSTKIIGNNSQFGSTESLNNLSFFKDIEQTKPIASNLFGDFMKLYTDHTHSADAFDLVNQYEEVCRTEIKTLLAHIHKIDPTRKRSEKSVRVLQQLYQECYSWRLIGSLFRDRFFAEGGVDDLMDDGGSVDSSKSEKLIVEQLFERDASVRQCQIVVDWLEKNAQDKLDDLLTTDSLHFHSDSVYWEHTAHDLAQLKMGSKDPSLLSNLVTEIDPDAPLRQQRQLSNLDQQTEDQLLMYMFKFIRAGKLEEAQKLCFEQGHHWRAATIDGWRLWHDPNFFTTEDDIEIHPAEGNPDRDLWKLNSWSMSSMDGCHKYEKAIYGALSGHLKQLLPVCSSWDDCLWAFFKVLVDISVEREIRNQPRSNKEQLDLPEDYWKQIQNNDLTPNGIMEQLRSHKNSEIRKQCDGIYQKFQSNIILNDIKQFLEEMKTTLDKNINDPHLVRFMAHLVLFLQALGLQTQEDTCIAVLHKYVQILIEEKENDLIAVYTARLPLTMQVDVYANFLQGITDVESRQTYLHLAEEAGLDLPTITKCIVENVRSGNSEESFDEKTTKADLVKISSIDWLIFDPAQRAEALKQANAIIRGFLAGTKHDACQQLFNRIPIDSINVIYTQWKKRAGEKALPGEDDNAIREYLCIKAYLNAHEAFNAWFEHYHTQAPLEPEQQSARTFKEQIAFEETTKEYELEFARWMKTLELHVKSTSEAIYNVLLFPGGWMVDQANNASVNEGRSQQMVSLRQLCIPYLSFLLFSLLQSSRKHQQCFQLAEKIQSRHHKLYEVFQKSELQKVLSLLRDSSVALLQEGYDSLGFVRNNAL